MIARRHGHRPPLRDAIDAGWCPHLAMLLRRPDEVAPTLASFYALGAQRNGWLFHRSLRAGPAPTGARSPPPGSTWPPSRSSSAWRSARSRSTSRPRSGSASWEPELDGALARGFDAAWWARFPIGPDEEIIARSDAYDRAWDERMHGRPCVSLCLFIVGDLEAPAEQGHVDRLAEMHDGVLVSEPAGPSLVRTPGR